MAEEQELSLCDTEEWKKYIDSSIFEPQYVILDSHLKQVAKEILDCFSKNPKFLVIVSLFGAPNPGIAFEIKEKFNYYCWLEINKPIHVGMINQDSKEQNMQHVESMEVDWNQTDDVAQRFYDFIVEHNK